MLAGSRPSPPISDTLPIVRLLSQATVVRNVATEWSNRRNDTMKTRPEKKLTELAREFDFREVRVQTEDR